MIVHTNLIGLIDLGERNDVTEESIHIEEVMAKY